MLNKQILQALLTKNQNIDIKINKSEIIIFLDESPYNGIMCVRDREIFCRK